MVDLLLLLLVIGLIGYAVYKCGTMNEDYFTKRGLNYMKPKFLIGNMTEFFLGKYSMYDFVCNVYSKCPQDKYVVDRTKYPSLFNNRSC